MSLRKIILLKHYRTSDGTVTAVLVNKGDSVLEGAEIVKIA